MKLIKEGACAVVSGAERVCSLLFNLSGVCLVLMLLMVTLEVLLRYGFQSPTLWTEELCRYMFVFMVFLPAGYAFLKGAHIKLDILSKRLPAKGQVYLGIIHDLLALVFCIVVIYQGISFVKTAITYDLKSGSGLATPLVIPYLFIPIGIGLLSLVILFAIIRNIGSLISTGKQGCQGGIK